MRRDYFDEEEVGDRQTERRSQSQNEESSIDDVDAHLEEVDSEREDEEDPSSQNHPLASPEISETHPQQRTQ